MQPTRPSNVVTFQQRPSKADLAFAPILSQKEIDRQSADEKTGGFARVAGVLLCVAALAAFYRGHLVVGWLFLGGYAITKGVELMDNKTAERLAMQKLKKAHSKKASLADRLAFPAWIAMLILGAAIIVAIYFGVN